MKWIILGYLLTVVINSVVLAYQVPPVNRQILWKNGALSLTGPVLFFYYLSLFVGLVGHGINALVDLAIREVKNREKKN